MTQERNVGMVKWFNNKTGYGFITVLSDAANQNEGKDIFVHYKSIRTVDQEDSNYKYLVQGEYVEFDIVRPANEKHEYHAVDITGMKCGPTMCETRRVASLAQRDRGPVVDDREFVRVQPSNRRQVRKPSSTLSR
jgi:hypothetical protein